jgi:hypothetical protein
MASKGTIRTVVTFNSSAFNTSEPRDYFINPCCFGDDVGKWLIEELRARDIATDDEPDQEDFGWFFNFELPDDRYCLVIGHIGDDDDSEAEHVEEWWALLELKRGLLASLFGGRNRIRNKNAPDIIHSILSNSSEVQDICWHYRRDFFSRH